MIVRARFSKRGRVRWISHRDVARVWERALRRARLPMSYTGGFSPRPQLSFGLALPTGCESVAEYVDVALSDEIDPDELSRRLRPEMPAGFDVLAVGERPPGTGSLQEEVSSCAWEISVPGISPEELGEIATEVLSRESLPVERERKGRQVSDDLRPSVLGLTVVLGAGTGSANGEPGALRPAQPEDPAQESAATAGNGTTLAAELGTRPRGVRPVELARVMGVEFGSVTRTRQWIERDGSKFEPLPVRAAVLAGATEHAS